MHADIQNLGPAPSVSEVAALFKLHPSVIYRHLYAGNLEVIKGFGRARVCPRSIERFLSRTGEHKPGKSRGRRQNEKAVNAQAEAAEVGR
jgi:hypothetical protein